jgi:hypothetical protein
MNAAERHLAATAAADAVNDANPWLGLASFTEDTRAYFFGREDEVAELARRVQRKLLTVLFGQSGLGKTSILRAGLVPRLRDQGYCPVYVRIDYAREAPEPAEQIKLAIRRAASESGEWTQVGVAAENESLWEFLHHRDDVLRDSAGATLIPLLIFDQFEEIFTLAQSDDFGRRRAAHFIDELADLVENRPPKALEAQFELDESAAERFDFARSDYRVLIALREDYLAPLESLKQRMPSIAQNRLRLAPMTGTQALAAVLRPGRKLVSQEVAEAIVRFVAGGAELANAEVEPSLLSLICRELNDARIAQGRNEISLDLLAGSHATILSNFYERALGDQPAAVRRIIEDNLLTASGFRENVAEESLVKRFTDAGAAPDTLALLVNRRLLRVEERLDVRRVELTHDVLCSVVKTSRDQRQERDAREATERLLAEQRERELSARHALIKARQIASVCVGLAVVAVAAAVFAYFNGQRAQRAERQAQETRAQAEQARAQSEHLLGYLTDDFVRQLESFGQLKVISEFSQRQIDYFHALPPALKGPETIRNGALAMVHQATALRTMGEGDAGMRDANEAIQLLETARSHGDNSEATVIALARAYMSKARLLDLEDNPDGPATQQRAAALLKPLAEGPNPSVAVREAYVEALVRVGYEQTASLRNEEAVANETEAMKLAAQLGALDRSNLEMGAQYAEAAAWLVTGLINTGKDDQAEKIGEQAARVANQVLEVRPGYRLALHAAQIIESILASIAQDGLDPARSLLHAKRTEEMSITMLQLDPNNLTTINNLGVARQGIGVALWADGKLSAALPYYSQSVADFGKAAMGGTGFALVRAGSMLDAASRSAIVGHIASVEALIESGRPFLDRELRQAPGGLAAHSLDAAQIIPRAQLALQRDDLETSLKLSEQASEEARDVESRPGIGAVQRSFVLLYADLNLLRTQYARQDYAAAERAARETLKVRTKLGDGAVADRRDLAEISTWLAASIAQQGRLQEAAREIGPVVEFYRDLARKNHGDRWIPYEQAYVLYAQALSDPEHRDSLLKEAAGLLDKLAPEIARLHDVARWRARIQQVRSKSAAVNGPTESLRSPG